MHEFSIVQNILDIATEAAIQNRVKTVSSVEVDVGQASGVVPEAMDFAWESVRKGTIMEQASLVIRIVPLRVQCRECSFQFSPENTYDPCPECGAFNPEILSGKELRVTALQT